MNTKKMSSEKLQKLLSYYRVLKTWDCTQECARQLAREILGLRG